MSGISLEDKNILRERIVEVLEIFPDLKNPSGSLSGGPQQMLAIARGLIIDPEVLLWKVPQI